METRERQWEILSCLLEEREAKQVPDGGQHLNLKKIVVNISKRSLSSSEESITALGLNFVPAPTSISEKTIIAETEAVADEEAATLRIAVQSCLTNPKLPTSNITKGKMQALEKRLYKCSAMYVCVTYGIKYKELTGVNTKGTECICS